MLTGPELGAAIEAARKLKGVTKVDMAAHFGLKPPSIQDWVRRGTIGKDKLPALWAYFSDVVGPTHWGLRAFPAPLEARQPSSPAYHDPKVPRSLEAALRLISSALAGLGPQAREEAADAMQLWARYGGKERYRATVQELLSDSGTFGKRHATG